jgi:ribosomal protein S18
LPTIGKQRNKNLLCIQQGIIFPRDVTPQTKKNEQQRHLALAVQINRPDGLF